MNTETLTVCMLKCVWETLIYLDALFTLTNVAALAAFLTCFWSISPHVEWVLPLFTRAQSSGEARLIVLETNPKTESSLMTQHEAGVIQYFLKFRSLFFLCKYEWRHD